jgi:hypothetical protein
MGKEQDHHVADRKCLLYVSLTSIVLGIVAITTGIYGWTSQNLVNVDKIVKINVGDDGPFILTVHKCMIVLIIIGVVAILSSAGGAYGAQNQHKGLTCQYLVVTAVLGIALLFMGVHALNRQVEVQSVVTAQIQDLCRKDDYIRYTQNLGCPGAPPAPILPCTGDICTTKLEMLKKLNACSLMPRVCRIFVYTKTHVDAGLLSDAGVTLGSDAGFYTSANITDGQLCEDVCNEDVTCPGYANDVPCTIASDNTTRYTATTGWTAELKTFSAVHGWNVKGNPAVLDSFQKHGTRLADMMLALALIMLVAAFLTWKVQYNQTLDKEGKPGAGQICRMLCCCPVDKKEYRDPVEEDGLLSS